MAIAQFSGLASGIDSGALIDAVIEAREIRNDLRREDIDALESETEALTELDEKITAFSQLIDKFRTANGGGVAKRGSSTDPAVGTATATSAAINATYALTVTSVADSATGSFDNNYGAADSVVSASSGSVTITVGTGGDQVVLSANVVGGATTLTELATALNADTDADGRAVASVVNIGTEAVPDYRLLVTSLETGTTRGTIALGADPAITELQASTVDQATDAIFTIGGIGTAVTRSSNSIADVISGVTFNLLDTGTTNITIANDADATTSEIDEIVAAFNDIVEFVNENDTVERVEDDANATNIFGSLAQTRVDDDFISSFRTALSGAVAADGTEVTTMSQLGISTNRNGTLTFDEDAFKEAVGNDPIGATGVLNSFGDAVAGINGFIFQYTRLNGFIDVAQQANNDEIENLNDAIAQLERQTAKTRDGLTKQFAALERTTARLQGQQQALSGVLAGL